MIDLIICSGGGAGEAQGGRPKVAEGNYSCERSQILASPRRGLGSGPEVGALDCACV